MNNNRGCYVYMSSQRPGAGANGRQQMQRPYVPPGGSQQAISTQPQLASNLQQNNIVIHIQHQGDRHFPSPSQQMVDPRTNHVSHILPQPSSSQHIITSAPQSSSQPKQQIIVTERPPQTAQHHHTPQQRPKAAHHNRVAHPASHQPQPQIVQRPEDISDYNMHPDHVPVPDAFATLLEQVHGNGESPKSIYTRLKKQFKFLVYENECYQEELRNSQRHLLKLSRDKNFLLDRLMSYEKVDDKPSDDSDAESVATVDEKPKPKKKKTQSQPRKRPTTAKKAAKDNIKIEELAPASADGAAQEEVSQGSQSRGTEPEEPQQQQTTAAQRCGQESASPSHLQVNSAE